MKQTLYISNRSAQIFERRAKAKNTSLLDYLEQLLETEALQSRHTDMIIRRDYFTERLPANMVTVKEFARLSGVTPGSINARIRKGVVKVVPEFLPRKCIDITLYKPRRHSQSAWD